MAYRVIFGVAALLSCLCLQSLAAETQVYPGVVSGPRSGSNIIPNTAIQKNSLKAVQPLRICLKIRRNYSLPSSAWEHLESKGRVAPNLALNQFAKSSPWVG
jgi:hypothetical protein